VISNIIDQKNQAETPWCAVYKRNHSEITIDPHPTQALSKVEGVVQALELILS
jgi:hypothetical protein